MNFQKVGTLRFSPRLVLFAKPGAATRPAGAAPNSSKEDYSTRLSSLSRCNLRAALSQVQNASSHSSRSVIS